MKCIFLKILIVSMLCNMIAMPIHSGVAVLFGYICLASTALLPFELIRYRKNHVNKKQLSLIITIAFLILLNSAQSFLTMSKDEVENVIKVLVSFLAFLLAIAVDGTTYTENDLRFCFTVIRLSAIVFVLYTVLPFGFQYSKINKYGDKQFTLSMGNPNATAVKVMFCVIMLCIESRLLKNKYLLCLNLFLIAGLLITIFKLESRTALFCSLLYILHSAVLKIQVKKWMLSLVWFVPLLFIPIQFYLVEFSDFEILGKTLASGRETLFSEFIEVISTTPQQFILGDFIENQMANGHNIFFTLLFNLGFVGVVCFLIFWRNESGKFSKTTTKLANEAWMGWIVFVIHSMAEAAVLSGSFTFGIILVLLNRMSKDQMVVKNERKQRYDLAIKEKIERKI